MREPHTIPLRTGSVDLTRRRIRRDGQDTPLSRLEAALLSYLAERPNQEVSRDELLREVWGHAPTSTSRAVDFTVNRLRQKLGETDPPEQLLTAHGVGYRFVPHEHDPEPAAIAPTPAGPRTLIRTAGGILDLDRQSFERSDGSVVALSRIDAAVIRRLASPPGRPVALDALATDVWGRGQHRQSVATALVRLRKKLERDPTHPEVLVTTPGFGVRLEGEAAVHGERTNLAPVGSSFVKGTDVGGLLERVAKHPLVTLRGTGGIGKTRLARQLGAALLAREPHAEVWFCDLASVGEAQGIAETVAQQIGIDPAGQDLVGRLGRVLARRPGQPVLILDNYEHLVPFAWVVATWRAAAPDVRIWVTSRLALELADEVCIDVKPLDDDAAARLFVDRSPVGSDPDSPAIRALVRRLDGLPLAIELAAARAHQLTPETLLARIGERLDLLVRPARDNQSHHTTLRGAFDWSWDLLGADERAALAKLSVLVSPFDAATAVGLLGDGGDGLVVRLASHSLVHGESVDRWRLFEAIREYAGEKLVLSGDREAVYARRAALFLDRAERLVPTLAGAGAGASYRGLRAIRDEIVAVYQTVADADLAARAALVVAAVEETTGPTAALGEMLTGAIDGAVSVAYQWELWFQLAATATSAGDDPRARQALDRALALAEQHSDKARAIVVRQIGLNEASLGNYASATRRLDDARTAFLALGERGWAGRTLGNLAYLQNRTATRSRFVDLLGVAVAEVRASGEVRHLPALLIRMGDGLLYRGEIERARACLDDALVLARSFQDHPTELRVLGAIANVDLEQGRFELANARYLDLERRYRAMGLLAEERSVRLDRGFVALERGDLLEAEAMLGDWDPGRASLGARLLREVNLAVLRLLQGHSARARAMLLSVDIRWDLHHRYWIYTNSYLGIASALEGDLADAEARLADVRARFDREFHGVDRFLDLCDGIVDLVRMRVVDPERAVARANAVLAAGTVIRSDDGHLVERPEDVNYARRLLIGLVARTG